MSTENTQTPEAPVPGSPEYNEAMAAKGREHVSYTDSRNSDAVNTGQEAPAQTPAGEKASAPVKPDNVPDKFWDAEKGEVRVEALLQSYSHLEKNGAQPAPAEVQIGEAEGAEAAATETAKGAGLDYAALTEKVIANGSLDDTDYQAFEKAGVPRQMVDEYVEMKKGETERARVATTEYIGGEEATAQLLEWAAKSLDEGEKAVFNAQLKGPGWKAAVDTLKTRMAAASPKADEPKLVTNGGSPAGSSAGYPSRNDFNAAMRDPRYHEASPTGEAYRQEVMAKRRASNW